MENNPNAFNQSGASTPFLGPSPQGYYGQPPAGYLPPGGNACYTGQPVTVQPMGPGRPFDSWMCKPQAIANCPSGLEYLSMIDEMLVYQTMDKLDTISTSACSNQYYIANSLGQKVYYAREYSNNCAKRFGSSRPFEMKLFDNFGQQVISISRPLACQRCCCPCCLQTMEITAPVGTLAGSIEQKWSLLHPIFAIRNPSGDTVLQIKGPWCTSTCCSDVDFDILSADGDIEVGKISKKWAGIGRESSSTSDSFGISFPMDLDVRMKAVMLGACFLIDMMYFETASKK